MKKENIKGKKIFITGITGFVGKALAESLSKKGAIVYGISRNSSSDKKIYKCDILDIDTIEKIVRKNKITSCVHLAGESVVESGQENPYMTFFVNTHGTLNILELARRYNFEKVIIASTSHVYGKNKIPYFETYTPRPSRPYETSKAATDLMAQSYADTYDLPVLIGRFVNIYGHGDLNFTRLIPKTIKNLLQNKKPTMWGGAALRDFLYIDDAVSAYEILLTVPMERVGKNKVFNFGAGNPITVRDLIDLIIVLSGYDMYVEKVPYEREDEIRSSYVSAKKANRILGWSAKVSLETGLKKAIDWYEEYFKTNLKSY